MPQPLPCHDDRAASSRARLLAWFRRPTAAPQDAEDLTHEVLARMEERYAGLPDEEWFPVLHRVRATVLADHWAARLNRVASMEVLPASEMPHALRDQPEESAMTHEELREAVRRIAAASPDGARALLRHELLGEPYATLAELEGVSEGAVQVRASRARGVLKRLGRWAFVPAGTAGGATVRRLVLHRAVILATAGGAAGAGLLGSGIVATTAGPAPSAAATSAPVGVPAPAPTAAPAPGPNTTPAAGSQARGTGSGAPPPAPPASASRRRMQPVAAAHVGDPSTVAAGAEVQRDGDSRSPLAQLAACLATGPRLDLHDAGCP